MWIITSIQPLLKSCHFSHFHPVFWHTSKSLKLQVLYHFGEHFWCLSRWKGQKFNFWVILYDFLDGQDPFTKSGCHARSSRPEVWNFAWDLVWPINMPYKNTGSIWVKKLIFVHPSMHVIFIQVLLARLYKHSGLIIQSMNIQVGDVTKWGFH